MTDEHTSPPTVPALSPRERRDRRRACRDHLDRLLREYWRELIAESEPMAEAILERALKTVALEGTLFV
jgi:hypothetical protein